MQKIDLLLWQMDILLEVLHPLEKLYAITAVLRRRTKLFTEFIQLMAAVQWAAGYIRPAVVQQWQPVQCASDQWNRQPRVQWLFQLRALSARQHQDSD